MFIQLLTKQSLKFGDKKSKAIEYNQLAEYVQSKDNMEFLRIILPKKITVKEFRQIMEKEKNQDSSDDSSSEEDQDEDDADDSGSSSSPSTHTTKWANNMFF